MDGELELLVGAGPSARLRPRSDRETERWGGRPYAHLDPE